MNDMDQKWQSILRLQRRHKKWIMVEIIYAMFPIFAWVNKFRPILSDGYGHDILPDFFPDFVGSHYNLFLIAATCPLLLSEFLRRRFQNKHADVLSL